MKESESAKGVDKRGQESPDVALGAKGKEGEVASKGPDGKSPDGKSADGKGSDDKDGNDQKSPVTSPEQASSSSQQQSPSAQGQPSAEQQQPRQSGSGIDRGAMLKGAGGIAAIIALASMAIFIPGAAALALGLGAGLAMGGALNGGHEAIKRSSKVADEGQSSQGNDGGVGGQQNQARSQGQAQGQEQQQSPTQQGRDQKGPDQQGPDQQGKDQKGPDQQGKDQKGPDQQGKGKESKDSKADKAGLDIDKLNSQELKDEIDKQRSEIKGSMGIKSEYKDELSVQMDISRNFLGGVGPSSKMVDGPKDKETDYDRGVSFSQSASKILESKTDDDLEGQKEQLKGLLKLKELVGKFQEATEGKKGQDKMNAKVEFLKSDECKDLKGFSDKVSPPSTTTKDDSQIGKSERAEKKASKAKDDSAIGMESASKDGMAGAIREVRKAGLVEGLSMSASPQAPAPASASALDRGAGR
jgi:hypothetical protein